MRHEGQGLKGAGLKGGVLLWGLWGCGAEMWGWGIYGAEL